MRFFEVLGVFYTGVLVGALSTLLLEKYKSRGEPNAKPKKKRKIGFY